MVCDWILLIVVVMVLLMAALVLLGRLLPFANAMYLCLTIAYWLIWPCLVGLGVAIVSFIIAHM
nr:MAG TPA_asm: hypothetical protein [Caudoviricetes sp.]